MKQQLDASQTARDVEVLLIEAGWIQAADKRNGEPAPFLQGSPKLFVINAIHDGTEYAIGGGENEAHRTPMDAARYLIGMIQPKAAEPVEAVAPVTYTPAAEPAPAETDPRDAEIEALRARVAELEAAPSEPPAPEPEPTPEPVEAAEEFPEPDERLIPSDLAQLMLDDEPLSEAVSRMTPSLDELLDMAEVLSDASLEQAASVLSPEIVEDWTERLWVEKARLRTKRATEDENLSRENLISRVTGIFMRVGSKR
jgi:hypothetical protein